MRLVEYRIFMPLTLEENLRGQIWSFSEVSRVNTSGGEGVEVLVNENFQLPKLADGRINYKELPNFEDYETQKANSKTSVSYMKKSASKENFTSLASKKILPQSDSLERNLAAKATITASPQAQNNGQSPTTPSSSSSSIPKSVSESVNLSNGAATAGATANGSASDSDSETFDSNAMSASSNPTKEVQTFNQTNTGQFTHKLYKLASKLPWFVRKILPKDSTMVHEKSWNMYPCVKTVLINEYFRNCCRVELDTITRECPNGLAEDNVHNLTPEQLEKREVVVINIADPLTGPMYKQDEDPALFKSAKTGRGPLDKDWLSSGKTKPLICCYKLVFVEFKVFGLQTRSENYLINMYKQLFTIFHRQIFCWMDKWSHLSLQEVRKIEEDLAEILAKKIDQGEVSRAQLGDE